MDITPPEREDEQNEEDVNPIAGLVLNCLANCFVSLLSRALRVLDTRLVLEIFCPTRTQLGLNTTRTE